MGNEQNKICGNANILWKYFWGRKVKECWKRRSNQESRQLSNELKIIGAIKAQRIRCLGQVMKKAALERVLRIAFAALEAEDKGYYEPVEWRMWKMSFDNVIWYHRGKVGDCYPCHGTSTKWVILFMSLQTKHICVDINYLFVYTVSEFNTHFESKQLITTHEINFITAVNFNYLVIKLVMLQSQYKTIRYNEHFTHMWK